MQILFENNNLYGFNIQLLSSLVPRRKDEPSVEIERVTGLNQIDLDINYGDTTDTIIVSSHSRNIELCGLRGEAAIVIARRNTDDSATWWVAAYADALEVVWRGGSSAEGRAGDFIRGDFGPAIRWTLYSTSGGSDIPMKFQPILSPPNSR